MTTGQRIKAARKRAGMTQADLAKRLGISYVNISQLEKDQRNPKLETLQRIAAALGISIYELIDGDDLKRAVIYGEGPDSDSVEQDEDSSKTQYQIDFDGSHSHDWLSEDVPDVRAHPWPAPQNASDGVVIREDRDITSGRRKTVDLSGPEVEALLGRLQDGEPLVLSPDELAKLKDTPKKQIAAALDKQEAQDKAKWIKTGAINTDAMRPGEIISLNGRMGCGKTAIIHWLTKVTNDPQRRIAAALNKLNDEGQEKVATYAEDLVEMPKYQAQEPPTAPAQDTPPAPEGTDTTPAGTPPEGPQEPPESRITSITMICPICGMKLRGDPTTGKAHCPYCNRSFPLPKKARVPKR